MAIISRQWRSKSFVESSYIKLVAGTAESEPQPEAPRLPAAPPTEPEDRPLPINLPTALKLANVRAVDVAAAAERVQVAAAVLEHARTLWFPSITLGGDYFYHSGAVQDVSNTIFNDKHSAFMVGAGTGIGPAAVLTVADAIFTPLVARQQVRARQHDIQAASNDALVAVSDAYFNVQQARGELAGAMEATGRTRDLVRRTQKLAPSIVPELELFRAEAELANRRRPSCWPASAGRWPVRSCCGCCGSIRGPGRAGRPARGLRMRKPSMSARRWTT